MCLSYNWITGSGITGRVLYTTARVVQNVFGTILIKNKIITIRACGVTNIK